MRDSTIGTAVAFHIARNWHGVYCVPVESAHRPCARAIMRGQVWERDTLRALRQRFKGGGIVTAGTYFGDFLPFLCRLAARHGAQVWAFEPNRVNHGCAMATCGLNTLSNCDLHLGGLGAAPGQTTIRTHDGQGRALGGGSRLAAPRNPRNSAGYATIPIHTIDATVGDAQVGLIQLDVEGHELDALRGAEATIARCRPLLVLESHGATPVTQDAWLRDLLERHGYRETGQTDNNTFLTAS